MAQQIINLGTVDNDQTGDNLKSGGDKINDNFTELYGITEVSALRIALGVSYVIGKSAVAVSHTGDTSETVLATIAIPANAIGPNGQVEVIALWSYTNSGNNKLTKIRFGGTSFYNNTLTTTGGIQGYARIANRNAANSQVSHGTSSPSGFSTSAGAPVTAAIDTTSSVNITIAGQLANSSETITLESYLVRITYGA